MNMFCYQCQETGNGKGCTALGICGKNDEVASLQDLTIYLLKGLALFAEGLDPAARRRAGVLAAEALFMTVTNTNFDPERFMEMIDRVVREREALRPLRSKLPAVLPDCAAWVPNDRAAVCAKAFTVGVLDTADPDLRSVRETITYGLKGIAAYSFHAAVLGFYDDAIFEFLFRALAATAGDLPLPDLMAFVPETGKYTVAAMDLLDRANTATYGHPEPRRVNAGAGARPGILVTGHDLKDLELLMEQSKDAGVDVYTNGEMVLAQSLPFFRKYPHLAGNYGNAWWRQPEEFAAFNGPVLVTSNCIVPVEETYAARIFTTSVAGYPGVPHIREVDGRKDFSGIIALAKTLPPPSPTGENDFMSGFGHRSLGAAKDKVLSLVASGRIKRFVVMAGCDGRDQRRACYTDKALALPEDTVILTAGCAKYRFIKQLPGTIDGIPRVLDAGQCSDSYSLVVFAKELAAALGTNDLNALPLEFDIAWYDQKAVAVFLALLHLGIKKIRLGPTLPEFFTQYLHAALKDRVEVTTVCNE